MNAPVLTPVRRASLVEQVRTQLTSAIRQGDIRPGQPLRQESLARELSVSRTPLRQALAQLEVEGLVEDAGTGWRVRRNEGRHVLEMFEVCAAIEAQAARLAADRVDDGWNRRLVRAARRGPLRPSPDPAGSPTEFHEVVAAATGNPMLIRLRTAALATIDLSFVDTVSLAARPDARGTRSEHLQIAEAIARGDGELAAQLSSEHVLAGALRLRNALAAQD
jgi:DNA-binding GntR family transcriptional regulator